MSRPPGEGNPWAQFGAPAVRQPERMTAKKAASQTLGLVLLGVGGVALLLFVFLYFGLSALVSGHIFFDVLLTGIAALCLYSSRRATWRAVLIFIAGLTATAVAFYFMYDPGNDLSKPKLEWTDLALVVGSGSVGFAFCVFGYALFSRR
jgi:hypothetical protein